MKKEVSRRDQVNTLKKVFLAIKLFFMAVCSALTTFYLLYVQYSIPYIEKGRPHTMEQFLNTYIPDNILLVVSYSLCSVIAVSFTVFLALHGIQTLIVRFMMRNSG
ncbi:MAG: hypothetical protein E7640_00115 [Ruminococcaceae bacterium]|nr:hypothetical protein [Oscillospiraceae bacterium]